MTLAAHLEMRAQGRAKCGKDGASPPAAWRAKRDGSLGVVMIAAALAMLAANGWGQPSLPPTPTAPAASPTPLPIRDIAPPVDIPWPPWLIACAIIGGVLVFAGLVALIIWWTKKWPKAPPPTPRQLALRSLEELRRDVQALDPYAFSIVVSDVLRSYIGAEYRLHAREQTSPEFLAAIAQSPQFYDADRKLLAEFLEHCDLIKFARIHATTDDSARLLQSAISFVQGGAAQ